MGEGSSEDGFDRISIASSISEPVGESQSSESNLQSPAIPVTAHGRYSDTSARSSSLPVGEEDSPDASHRSTSQPVGEGDSYDAASESSRAAVRNSQTERVLDIFDPAYSRPLSSHAAPLNSASGGYGSSSPEVGLGGGPGKSVEGRSDSSSAVGESSDWADDQHAASVGAQAGTAERRSGLFTTSFQALNGPPSPTLHNPALTSSSNASTDEEENERAELLEGTISVLTWFEDEMRTLRKAKELIAQTPEARISSRSEYWSVYNRVLGARGPIFRPVWEDLADLDA